MELPKLRFFGAVGMDRIKTAQENVGHIIDALLGRTEEAHAPVITLRKYIVKFEDVENGLCIVRWFFAGRLVDEDLVSSEDIATIAMRWY